MYVERLAVSITTDANGDATVYTDKPVTGYVLAIRYAKPVASPLADTVDFVITGETSGIAIATWSDNTASGQIAPRMATHAVADASALLYAALGAAVCDPIPVANERIKTVVAQGGATLNGTLYFYVGG